MSKVALIFFVIVVSTITLGILNFFNILKISNLFSNQLGWLAHKPFSEAINKQAGYTNKLVPTLKSSLPIVSSDALKILTKLLPQILLSSLVPNTLEIAVKPDKIEQNGFTAEWHRNQATISAAFALLPNKIENSYLQLYVIMPQNLNNPNEENAKIITSQFFTLKTEGKWICKKSICDNFWTEADGTKKGINLSSQLEIGDNKKGTVITFCEYKKDTPLYKYSSGSCFSGG